MARAASHNSHSLCFWSTDGGDLEGGGPSLTVDFIPGFSVCSLCIVVGSRGPAGVSCCSSTAFSLCLSWFPVYCCWQWRCCWGELLQQYWIQLVTQLVPCALLLAVEVLLGWVAAAVLDSACISVGSLCIVADSGGVAGVSCCSSTGFSLCLGWFPVYCCWQWRSCWGELLQQYWIQLVSQLVPCVLLLTVEVLLGWVAAAVLDSACVSVGSLCIVADSGGVAGVSCCSSTGFSLCLSWFPVYCCWQWRCCWGELVQQYWIQLVSQLVAVYCCWQ